MSDFSLSAALCFDNEQGGLRCTCPRCYDARRRVGRCIWRGGSRPSLAPTTKRKGRSPVAWELRPFEEADGTEHGEVPGMRHEELCPSHRG